MDEGRKRVLLIAASILAARKLAQFDGGKRVPATMIPRPIGLRLRLRNHEGDWLRHSDVATTLGIYAHSMSEDRLAAQDDMLAAMMTPSNVVN
jgi:hypothetical protein